MWETLPRVAPALCINGIILDQTLHHRPCEEAPENAKKVVIAPRPYAWP
jgi:hypothetical protein